MYGIMCCIMNVWYYVLYYECMVLCVDVEHSDKSHFSQGYKQIDLYENG